jgi:hypothetical protein
MRVMLCQLDGKIPNIALMRISAHHRKLGDAVEIRHGADFRRGLFDSEPDKVYASAIFRKSIPLAEELKKLYPAAILGGTGVDPARKGELIQLSGVISATVTNTEAFGVNSGEGKADLDYSHYSRYTPSIGFTQRGCRLNCSFCVVGDKEGPMRDVQGIYNVWRGEPHPRHLHLLDNDFFGQPGWRTKIKDIREGRFKVSFNQGINARFLTDEAAEGIASIDYRDDQMQTKRIYTAWDNLKDETRLFDGLNRLVKYGVKPDHIMVYVLCGYWPGETQDQRVYRVQRLLDFGARPFPMAYIKTPEIMGLQRWAIGAYSKRIPWTEWAEANYRPEKLRPFVFPMLPGMEVA